MMLAIKSSTQRLYLVIQSVRYGLPDALWYPFEIDEHCPWYCQFLKMLHKTYHIIRLVQWRVILFMLGGLAGWGSNPRSMVYETTALDH